jgi:hypothetical protein
VIGAIRRNRLVDPRQTGVLGVLGIDHGGQMLVLGVDERTRVLDPVAVLPDHSLTSEL